MKARHKKAAGGNIEPQGKFDKDPAPKEVYAGGDSNVVKEARSAAKKGGKMCKSGGDVTGDKAAKRMDRKPREKGGKLVSNNWEAAQSTTVPSGRDITTA